MGDFWDFIKDASKVALPFVGAGLDFFGGLLQNSANADEAARNRRFVAAMYKKRYQNTMEDMRKAGLNPVLAMNSGIVGSSPGAGGIPHMENALGGATGTALSVAQGMAGIRKSEQDIDKSEAETDLTRSKKIEQDINNDFLPDKARALAAKAEAEASLANSAAMIQKSRAQYSDSLAHNEYAASNLRNEREVQSIRNEFTRDEILRRSPEYTMSAAERRWLERVKAVMGSVNSASGSFLSSVKALRYLR